MDVTGDKTRREVLARYCIDAGEGKLGVCAKKTVFNENKKTGVGMWLHEEQIAVLLNSEKLAKMQIKELSSQPSSIKSAAAEGILEYYYIAKADKTAVGSRDEVSVTNEQEISAEAYNVVAEDMQNLMAPSSSIVDLEQSRTRAHPGVEPRVEPRKKKAKTSFKEQARDNQV